MFICVRAQKGERFCKTQEKEAVCHGPPSPLTW